MRAFDYRTQPLAYASVTSPPPTLRETVESVIVANVDTDRLRSLLEVERAAKESLEAMSLRFGRPA